MTSLRIYFGVPMPPCMLTIWPSGPPPQTRLKPPLLSNPPSLRNMVQLMETSTQLQRSVSSSFFSTDPHQATFQPRLNLLGFPLLFNSTPKFLGVTFDRTLSFGAHVQSPVFQNLSTPQSPSLNYHCLLGSHKRISLSTLQSFVRPVLTYAFPGWFPFLCNTTTNHLEVLHRAACRVNYWLPLFRPLLTTPSRGPTPSSKADSRASDPLLL